MARTKVSAMPSRKATHSSGSHSRSRHWFAIFVNICMAVAPIALARPGAAGTPPAVEMCAPRSRSSTVTLAPLSGSCQANLVSAQPRSWIDSRPTVPDLEMKMRWEIRIRCANLTDDLALRNVCALRDAYFAQRSINRVIAATVFHDHRLSIGSKLAGKHHISRRDRVYRCPRRSRNSDSIPAQRRIVRAHHATKVVQDVAVYRPVELAVIRCLDRAIPTRNSADLAAPATTLRFDIRDDVVKRRLALFHPRQPFLSLLRIRLHAYQTLLPLPFQPLEARVLLSLFESVLLYVALQRYELPPTATNRRAKVIHSFDQRAIVHGYFVQVFVSRDQLAERVGREKRLKVEQWTALVDLNKSVIQNRTLGGSLVFRTDKARAGGGHLVRNQPELLVKR